jgi:hypothetical protein
MASNACALPAGFLLPESETPAGGWRWSCRLEPKGQRRSVLHLSGSLHVAWAGRLAAGLAARNIGVVRADARRGAADWTADIEIQVLPGAVEPSAVDFVALMREHAGPSDAGALVLASCRVARTRRDVQVEVRAEDAVGFLGRLLLLFAELRLYPREMRVETVGSEVRDVFFLQGATGDSPPDAIVAALRKKLEERCAR